MTSHFDLLPERHLPAMSPAEQHEWIQRRLSRRSLLKAGLVGAGAAGLGPILWRQPGYAATTPMGAHLVFGDDPGREMIVSWLTTGNVQDAVVDIGVDTSYGRTVQAMGRSVSGTGTVYQHAVIGGLDPETRYYYRLRHQGATGGEASFQTAAPNPSRFRFCAFGDQGADAGADGIISRLGALDPSFVFHVGDLCYASRSGGFVTLPGPTDHTIWDKWFGKITTVAAHTPWMPAVGNAEIESGYGPQGYDGYLARFAFPSNGATGVPVTYSFRYGNVGFIALDANDASYEIRGNTGYTGARQDAWLAATLAAMRSDSKLDFIVVGFHQCAYCSHAVHGSDGGIRQRWLRLFDQFTVDLVVNGHNHAYERTHPLRGGRVASQVAAGGTVRPAVDGVTYITAGGGGKNDLPVPEFTYPYSTVHQQVGATVEEATWSAVRRLGFSLIVADVTRTSRTAEMAIRAVTPDGQVFDSVTLRRSRVDNSSPETSGTLPVTV